MKRIDKAIGDWYDNSQNHITINITIHNNMRLDWLIIYSYSSITDSSMKKQKKRQKTSNQKSKKYKPVSSLFKFKLL